jgi:hypothetical protein
MPIKLPNVLSPSRTELAARCYRRHLLSDVAGRVKGKSPSAAFGTVMHGGVGNWWQFGDPTMALEETQKLWDEYEAQMNVKHSRELATNMINWYIQNVSLAGMERCA